MASVLRGAVTLKRAFAPERAFALERAAALKRGVILDKVQAAALWATGTIGAVSAYGLVVPWPDVYIDWAVQRPTCTAQVQLRNSGGCMVVTKLEVAADGKKCPTMAEALDLDSSDGSVVASPFESFFNGNDASRSNSQLSGRPFDRHACVTLATVQSPPDRCVPGYEWEQAVGRRLADRNVTVRIEYEFLTLPVLGCVLRGHRTFEL
jgi:hypothetical protein